MFVATMNFLSDTGMIRAGQEVKNPSPAHIKKGLVREVKIVTPEVKNDTDSKQAVKRTRKPRNA